MYELSVTYISILVVTGFLAGIINTMAGGGSNLTIPALMIIGLPPEIANATNRVSVLSQTLTATYGFKKQGQLNIADLKAVVGTTIIGGLFGAFFASYMPSEYLKPTLLGSMSLMAAYILFKPNSILVPDGTIPYTVTERKRSIPMLLLAGLYGGFIQAGVGFVLIATFVGALNFDLLRANAMKVVATVIFTSIALLVFIFRDQIAWLPGILLGVGSIAGAQIAVKFAVDVQAKTLKIMVLVMTIFASAAAFIQ